MLMITFKEWLLKWLGEIIFNLFYYHHPISHFLIPTPTSYLLMCSKSNFQWSFRLFFKIYLFNDCAIITFEKWNDHWPFNLIPYYWHCNAMHLCWLAYNEMRFCLWVGVDRTAQKMMHILLWNSRECALNLCADKFSLGFFLWRKCVETFGHF